MTAAEAFTGYIICALSYFFISFGIQFPSFMRKLAAIMFTDIVGYSALMSKDEKLAMSVLEKNRNLHKEAIAKFDGEYIKEIGDGTLAIFHSSFDAVNCALEIQKACCKEHSLNVRIGIHIGDIIESEGDVFGDGVNVASRIEAAGEPGGIYISEKAYDDIKNKAGIRAEFYGEKNLKNIPDPVRIYTLIAGQKRSETAESIRTGHGTSKEKSIAVLPFQDMSPEKDQDYFCDGITEEIINALTHIQRLRVIARTTSFSYKNKYEDVRKIGKDLNVETILEGSLRKAGDKLRISTQLISISDGSHLWSERYDREMKDIFEIQDEISLAVAEKLKIHLFEEERKQVVKNKTQNLEAYQAYLKGLFHWNKRTREGLLKSIEYFENASEIDPDYALACTGLADSYLMLANWGYSLPKDTKTIAKKILLKSLKIDNKLADTYASLAFINSLYEWKWKDADLNFKKALKLNPNLLKTRVWYTVHLLGLGKTKNALEHSKRALELDPLSLVANNSNALLLYGLRQYDDAIKQFRKTLLIDDTVPVPYNFLFFIYLLKGLYADAVREYQNLLSKDPMTEQYVKIIGDIYSKSGMEGCLHWLIDEGFDFHKQIYCLPYFRAVCHALLGEKDKAFAWMEKVLEMRSDQIFLMLTDPGLDNLRGDQRFSLLLEKTGLQ